MKTKIIRALTAEMLKSEVDKLIKEKKEIIQILPTNERGMYLILFK